MSTFNADANPQAPTGAGFRVANPGADEEEMKNNKGKGSKGRGSSKTSDASGPSPPSYPADTAEVAVPLGADPKKATAGGVDPPKAPAEKSGGLRKGNAKERKLVTDFREQKSGAQPNALDTLNPNAGVTLRQMPALMQGSKPKDRVPTPPKPVTPDVNLHLTSAADWGTGGGVGGFGGSLEDSLPVTKPTERQRELEDWGTAGGVGEYDLEAPWETPSLSQSLLSGSKNLRLDEILEQNKGNLLLRCKDGELLVHKDVLAMASNKVARYLDTEAAAVQPQLWVSTDTVAQWKLVLGQLYPICPRPELALFELGEMIQVLGIAHEWELTKLRSHVLSSLVVKLPPSFTMDTENVLEWLFPAEEIHGKEFTDACLLFLSKLRSPSFQGQAAAGEVDHELAQGTRVKIISVGTSISSSGAFKAAAGCIGDTWNFLRATRLWMFLVGVWSSVLRYFTSQKKPQRVLLFCVSILLVTFCIGIIARPQAVHERPAFFKDDTKSPQAVHERSAFVEDDNKSPQAVHERPAFVEDVTKSPQAVHEQPAFVEDVTKCEPRALTVLQPGMELRAPNCIRSENADFVGCMQADGNFGKGY
eukprot:gene8889-3772_t